MSTSTSTWTAVQQRRRKVVKRLIIAIVILVLVVLIGTMGLSFYVGWNLTHPKRSAITKTPKSAYGLVYRDIEFPSRKDATELKGWLIPANHHTDRIVIEAHGYRQNRMEDDPALPSAFALHRAGIPVIMFDFRDAGVSSGNEVTVGLLEERDLLGAIDYAKSLGYRHIGLLGFSMGASTSLDTAADDPSDVEAIVADSPFANLNDYLTVNMPVWTHLPNWPFTGEILWEMKTFLQLDAHGVDPLGKLGHWKARPLLLIAGTADNTIPAGPNSKAIYKEVKSNAMDTLWMVAGAKHVGAYKVAPREYVRRITQFFTDHLNHQSH